MRAWLEARLDRLLEGSASRPELSKCAKEFLSHLGKDVSPLLHSLNATTRRQSGLATTASGTSEQVLQCFCVIDKVWGAVGGL